MAVHTNSDIADRFDEIADLLEIEGANPFRIRAYRNASRMLRSLGVEIAEMRDSSVCCGFGGSFSFEFPEVASVVLEKKLANIATTGADVVITDNPGCLTHLRGGLDVRGQPSSSQRPFVRLGHELAHPALAEIALVGACYGLVHRALGAVSLVGPVRMDYEKALGAVRSAAQELSRFVESIYDEA